MENAIYKGKLYDVSSSSYEGTKMFTLLSKNPHEGFREFHHKFGSRYKKAVSKEEIEDYYKFDYFPIVQEQRCQIIKIMLEENFMRIVHSGYELNKFYEPEHVFDQSDFVYVIPIEEASRFMLEVCHFEKPDFQEYMGKEIFAYTYEEFMESYKKEVLDRM